MIKKISIYLLISASIYVVVALSLTVIPVKRNIVEKSLHFEALTTENIQADIAQNYQARDGENLFYRLFDSDSNKVVVLLHGSGTEGRYLSGLAQKLSASNNAKVIVPDLRGHGRSALKQLGDVQYLGQLEDDLSDLHKHLMSLYPNSIFILGGHSSGGGLAVKYGGKKQEAAFDGYVLLAPYLGHDAPTTRPNSGNWVQVSIRRYIGLSMLNNIAITLFNDTPVLFFNRPAQLDDELQIDSYSYRMNESFAPQDYAKYLSKNKQPIVALIGLNDEAFYAEKYTAVFAEYAPHAHVKLLDNVRHLDISDSNVTYQAIVQWLAQFNS